MESLPQDVVECILERLPVKSLARFKSVSNQWKSAIKSRFFQERQLFQYRQKSGDPDILILFSTNPADYKSLSTLVLGSSSAVQIPTPCDKRNRYFFVCQSSCDGLVCVYNRRKPAFVVNPTTRWYRTLPLCELQLVLRNVISKPRTEISHLGFGKDKFNGTYKLVWLYTDSAVIGLENATTCEVYDFSTNAWRYVTPSSPYQVALPHPVHVDGSLHWFTKCQETKVLSFDLHTEAFRVISKAPFANAGDYHDMVMCNLDNRLCVSNVKDFTQVIWSFNSGNKKWDKLCSIDLDLTSLLYNVNAILPLALLDGEKKKKKTKRLLFCDRYNRSRTLMTYELETSSYQTVFSAKSFIYPLCFFPSLISI